MLHDLSLALASIMITWLSGASVLLIIFRGELSVPEFAGFSYIVGAGVTAGLLYLSSMTGNQFSALYVYLFLAVAFLIVLIIRAKDKHVLFKISIGRDGPSRYYEYPLIFLVIFIIIAVVAKGISGFPNWDGILNFGFIAKSFFTANKIDMKFFTDPSRYGHVHLDYPLLLPLLEYWSYHFAGTDNQQLIQLLSITYYMAFAGIFYGSIRDTVPRPVALLSLLIVLYNPVILYDAVGGNADIVVAVYLIAVLVVYAKLLVRPSLRTAILLGVLVGFLANVKNEGFAFFTMFSLLLLFTPAVSKKAWVSYFIPSAVLGLPWFITKFLYGIRSDLFINLFPQVLMIKSRIHILLLSYFYTFTGQGSAVRGTGFLWLIVLLGLIVLFIYKPIREKYMMLWLPFILLFFIYSTVYLITPHSIVWQLGYSGYRTLTHLVPSLLWLSTVALWERYASLKRGKL